MYATTKSACLEYTYDVWTSEIRKYIKCTRFVLSNGVEGLGWRSKFSFL